jgi:hypothetical protein
MNVELRAAHHYVFGMKQSDLLREHAENCLQLAERAEVQAAFRRYMRMADAWTALANEQDWLDGEVSSLRPCVKEYPKEDRP